MDLTQAHKILELSLAEYSVVRAQFWSRIHDAVNNYLQGDRNIRGFLNDMRIAISEGYDDAASLAWKDGGGTFPMPDDVAQAVRDAIQIEYAYVDELAGRYKLLRKDEDFDPDIEAHEAFERADGYSKSLDRLYANIKLRAAGNRILVFTGEDGLESCKDCRKYKNKRHRASWWVSHNAIPPNRDFECKGFNCAHVLLDEKTGQLYTI